METERRPGSLGSACVCVRVFVRLLKGAGSHYLLIISSFSPSPLSLSLLSSSPHCVSKVSLKPPLVGPPSSVSPAGSQCQPFLSSSISSPFLQHLPFILLFLSLTFQWDMCPINDPALFIHVIQCDSSCIKNTSVS